MSQTSDTRGLSIVQPDAELLLGVRSKAADLAMRLIERADHTQAATTTGLIELWEEAYDRILRRLC